VTELGVRHSCGVGFCDPTGVVAAKERRAGNLWCGLIGYGRAWSALNGTEWGRYGTIRER